MKLLIRKFVGRTTLSKAPQEITTLHSNGAKLASSLPLFIVFNATSGAHDKLQAVSTIERVLSEVKREYKLFKIDRPQQIPTIAQAAVDQAVERNGAVIVAGGDGTINAVAAVALPTGQPFGLLPQGTFNYSCRAHAIPLDTEAALRALLSGRIKPIQVGRVNDRLFLVNASLGLYPQLLEDREQFKKQFGRKRFIAALAGLISLVRYRGQLQLQIEHDGREETIRTPTVFVGNNPLQLKQVGLPEVNAVQQRRLAAVIVRPVSGMAMLWLALRGAMGRLRNAHNVRDFPFSAMTVRLAGRSRTIKVATDGEIAWLTSPLRFTVDHQSLQLIVPVTAPQTISEP